MAMLYPALVAFLAFGLFVCGAVWFQPRVTQTYEVMGVPAAPLNLLLAELGRTAPLWAPWIPLVALVALAWWWYRSSRATARPPRWWHLAPAKRLLYYSRLATFADLLALLIEHGTPLGEAVVLAADAGGDKRLRLSAREFARLVSAGVKPNFAAPEVNPQVSSGAESTKAVPQLSGFPPLVSSLLVGGGNQAALVVALRNMAEAYHRRVERLDDWLRMYLPLSLVIAIGGTAVMIYALTLLGPWYQMLTHIGSTLR
jgi:type II secretory pathway component PulF